MSENISYNLLVGLDANYRLTLRLRLSSSEILMIISACFIRCRIGKADKIRRDIAGGKAHT